MGTAQLAFEEVERGAATGSALTGPGSDRVIPKGVPKGTPIRNQKLGFPPFLSEFFGYVV